MPMTRAGDMVGRMKPFVLLALAALTLQGCTSSRQLTFDVHPCAGEVHLSLADVKVVDHAHRVVPVEFAQPPTAVVRDGSQELPLGEFVPGCGNALRIHTPLPATKSATPTILLRGKLADGRTVTGCQQITAADYR